ncbi:LacI family DNA-binding transcriptional regulator [Enterococcus sp. DIV0876]|uniref:LacI family DNA-binding transcriptional regulator n=1 Tax=Enterococcus sp. DIV0876 TaxID=2774633 RepID=UPI003D2FF52D
MSTRTTIRDVAKEANVSIATVSKALNGVDVVKASTKAKVLAAAKHLHYVPNLMGKELKTNQTKRIGFYTTSITGPYFSVLIESIAREAEKHGYALNVFISMDKEVVLTSILGGAVDGFIGFEDMLDHEDLETIRNEAINAVFIDRNIQDHTFGSVVFDSKESAEYATSYLIAKGHREIVFVKGFDGVYDSDERLKGYQQALKKAQIPFKSNYLLEGRFEEHFAYQSTKKFLDKQKDFPSAFLAGNDLSAIGVTKAIEQAGYHVPNDFSVVGFDGIELLKYFRPSLTTIDNPIKEQGELATQHLLSLIKGEVLGKAFVLKGRLIEAESVKQFNRNE